ncbi:uncharacterized protein [Panulirus ornatus]|uniref:uncharacterized protein n=1 Tax=Panulirus ornatus TaxID=150431 RepID=UPI003A8A4B58
MCNEGRKLNNTITNGIRTNRSVFKMDSPLRTSPFWLNFESLRRKNVKHSLWNKFSSPYDVPASALHTLSPVPSALSRHKRTAQSFHPVSPRPPRHSGAPRSSPSLRSMKWNTTIIRDPHYALTAVKRESDSVLRSADDQRIPYNSVEKERKESLMRRKLRTSRSAEVLDDVLDSIEISCWGSRRRISEMSKSTDELEKVRNQWLKKLDQYKIHRGSSKSDESLNMLTDVDVHVTPQPLDGLLAVKVQPNKFSSLSRIKSNFWNTELDHKPLDAEAVIFDYQKQETTECRDIRNHLKYENAKKRLELEKVTEQERRENSRSGGGQGAETRKMIGTNDHPLLTVRPGVHLARSRSCGSRANKRVLSSYSEPDSYSQNSRKSSVSFSLGEAETMHTKNDGNHRISTTESPQRVIDTADSERDEENVIIEHITEVPKLRLHKYNLRRRPVKHDWSLPAPTCHHTFPGVSTDQVDGQRVRCSPDHCSYEGETLINGKQITVQTLDDPCRFFSARRRLFRSSLSPRSRSVDRMRTSLYQSHLSGKDRCFTPGPEDGVGLDPKIPALVSEDESGFCRGIIFDGSTSARTGIFPASLVARRETQGKYRTTSVDTVFGLACVS